MILRKSSENCNSLLAEKAQALYNVEDDWITLSFYEIRNSLNRKNAAIFALRRRFPDYSVHSPSKWHSLRAQRCEKNLGNRKTGVGLMNSMQNRMIV